MWPSFTRRSWLRLVGLGSLVGGAGAVARVAGQPSHGVDHGARSNHVLGHAGHALGTVGSVDTSIFNPVAYLRSFIFAHLPPDPATRRHAAA
jgi:hypothetical protein